LRVLKAKRRLIPVAALDLAHRCRNSLRGRARELHEAIIACPLAGTATSALAHASPFHD